jgi:hypothetical protein
LTNGSTYFFGAQGKAAEECKIFFGISGTDEGKNNHCCQTPARPNGSLLSKTFVRDFDVRQQGPTLQSWIQAH